MERVRTWTDRGPSGSLSGKGNVRNYFFREAMMMSQSYIPLPQLTDVPIKFL